MDPLTRPGLAGRWTCRHLLVGRFDIGLLGFKDALPGSGTPSESGTTCVRKATGRARADSHTPFGKLLPRGKTLMQFRAVGRWGLVDKEKPF